MLINAAPRSYTSNIVADADLNLEGYNVTANALYSKDNYLLTMLDYGEAFPTDVKEGDKLFAWGEDSTKSYIYTYKHGAWDVGVKPQHMVDYYIADENRTVNFYLIKPSSTYLNFLSIYDMNTSLTASCLVFGPNVYIVGSFSLQVYSYYTFDYVVKMGRVYFTDCTSISRFDETFSSSYPTISGRGSYECTVNVFSAVNAFSLKFEFSSSDEAAIAVNCGYELQ